MRKIVNLMLATGLGLLPLGAMASDIDQPSSLMDSPGMSAQLSDRSFSPPVIAQEGATPGETVEDLAAKANNWREPSKKSEEIYVTAIRQWLTGLPPRQRAIASQILRDAHPVMNSLRLAIREKKAELASLSFSRDTRPEALPRLGQELQTLRHSLRAELKKLGLRLKSEAGVSMGPLGGDGFWLAPPSSNS